jgi:hypothetical protein
MILVLIPSLLSIPLYAAKPYPVYHLFTKICPSLLGNSYLFSILRFFIIFEGLLEMSRILMLFILVSDYTLQTLSSCFVHLDPNTSKLRVDSSQNLLVSNLQLPRIIISIISCCFLFLRCDSMKRCFT